MKISPEGLQFIKDAEGCRLKAYQDSVGVLTIGVGHTRGVTEGMTINQEQADALLEDDLEDCYKAIRDYVEVDLTQGQFDALCSFIFNLGVGAFRASTLLRLLNDGDYVGAKAQFRRWDKAGGAVLAGLTKRRAGEAGMFA